jgi:hypothetical protein
MIVIARNESKGQKMVLPSACAFDTGGECRVGTVARITSTSASFTAAGFRKIGNLDPFLGFMAFPLDKESALNQWFAVGELRASRLSGSVYYVAEDWGYNCTRHDRVSFRNCCHRP